MPAVPKPSARPVSSRRRRPPAAVAVAGLAAAVLLGGCGNERQPPPDVRTPGPAFGSEVVSYPQAGLTLRRAPSGWARTAGESPMVAGIVTGEATIGIFRFPRSEPLPKTKADLNAAATALVAAAKARDPTFTEVKRGKLEVDGHPAIQIRGRETINGQPRTVRSTHIYAFDAEIVIDAYAPEASFRRVDVAAFRPLLATLEIKKPAAEGAAPGATPAAAGTTPPK